VSLQSCAEHKLSEYQTKGPALTSRSVTENILEERREENLGTEDDRSLSLELLQEAH
jgi:hypothetical protein